MSVAEHEILTEVHAERERCLGDLMAHLRAERAALAHLQTGMDIAGMRQAAGEAMADFVAIGSGHGSTLARTRQAAVDAQAEYDRFRSRNRLDRSPRQPGSRAYTWVRRSWLSWRAW